MKGLIALNETEVHRGHVLELVALHALSLKDAAIIMCVSYRHAKRLQKRWLEKGLAGLCHQNRGRLGIPPHSGQTFQLIPDKDSSPFRTLLPIYLRGCSTG